MPDGGSIPATHNRVNNLGANIYEFDDTGKIIRAETHLDQIALLSQLGVLQPITRKS